MDVVFHNAFLFDVELTAFAGIIVISGIIKTLVKKEKSKVRKRCSLVLYAILMLLWGYFIVYSRFIPISTAYYEYNHQHSIETTGVIENVEFPANSHIKISIDNKVYTMVYSDINPYQKKLGKEIKEGDLVQIQFGERSKYIFSICKIARQTNY